MGKIRKKTILKKIDRNTFQKDTTNIMLWTLLFMMLALILAYVGKFIGLNITHNEYIGICYLVYCAITIAIVYIINKDYVFDNKIKREEPTLKAFGKGFATMVAMMILFTIPVVVLDALLSTFDYTLSSLSEANSVSSSATEVLYVAVFGPICEEIIFRGLIQRKLEKYSPPIAIITSAIAFGLYHGNFAQLFPMIGTGLVFGYMAYRYSIKMSIAMHVVYNTVFGEVFGAISDMLEKNGEEFLIPFIDLSPFMTSLMILAGIGIAIMAKRILTQKVPFQEYRFKLKNMLYSFSSSGMMIFATAAFCMCINFIEKTI